MNTPRIAIVVAWTLLSGLAIGLGLRGVSILRLPGEIEQQQMTVRDAGLPPMDDQSRDKLRQAQQAAWESRKTEAVNEARRQAPKGWVLVGLGTALVLAFSAAAWWMSREPAKAGPPS